MAAMEESPSPTSETHRALRELIHQEIAACLKPESTTTVSGGMTLRSVVQELIQEEVTRQLQANGVKPKGPDPLYEIKFDGILREHIYAPHHQQSELRQENGAPLTVRVTDMHGQPAAHLEGLVVKAALLRNKDIATGELVDAMPRNPKSVGLLAGATTATVRSGVASFPGLRVTDNSSKFPGGRFVLEVRPALPDECADPAATNTRMPELARGIVKTARTSPFRVKSSRAKDNEKRGEDIRMTDPVFRLKNICKGGELARRLEGMKVFTVADFVARVGEDEATLRETLGRGMSDALWHDTWANALQAIANDNDIPQPLVPAATAQQAQQAARNMRSSRRGSGNGTASLYVAPDAAREEGPAAMEDDAAPGTTAAFGAAANAALTQTPSFSGATPLAGAMLAGAVVQGLLAGTVVPNAAPGSHVDSVPGGRAPSFDFEGFLRNLPADGSAAAGGALLPAGLSLPGGMSLPHGLSGPLNGLSGPLNAPSMAAPAAMSAGAVEAGAVEAGVIAAGAVAAGAVAAGAVAAGAVSTSGAPPPGSDRITSAFSLLGGADSGLPRLGSHPIVA